MQFLRGGVSDVMAYMIEWFGSVCMGYKGSSPTYVCTRIWMEFFEL